ncbi:DNA repair protein RecO [Candidatus Saccharibacteria bacterium]|nr:DNA repair protein RecO [Candidatus Saccharibacteria bacterium]
MHTPKDLKTSALVLRRTNYGEADRILSLITPAGKISAIARGVRKEKSKLAGGIELFSLSELNIHLGKSDLGIITSARMTAYYSNILLDLTSVELASKILKAIDRSAESIESPEFFTLAKSSLSALDRNISQPLVETWFTLNLNKLLGSELNLHRDKFGEKLSPEKTYAYDQLENAFFEHPSGDFTANEIKLLRLLLTSPLEVASRVKNLDSYLPKFTAFICYNK